MKNSFIALFLIFVNLTFAQKLELGNVTVAELQEKFHPLDSSAVASILYNKGKTFFEYREETGFRIVTEVEVKVKVYKKEGYIWANEEIPFYIGGSEKETVSFSKAVTYNLVNGQIEKSKLKSENEFSEQKNKFWSSRKIVMPNVKEGSIIEYKYTVKSPFYSTFPDWKFQKSIPVNYSEYVTEIPEYFYYNPYRKGAIMPSENTEKIRSSMRFEQKDMNVNIRSGGKKEYTVVDYTTNRVRYILQNIPALRDELFVNNIDNYTVALQHELAGIQYPQSQFESFSTTWENVARKIYESDDFGSQISKNNYYEADVNVLISGVNSDEEKMSAIFNYVKSRMNWNNFNSFLTDVGVKKAYQDKTGNVAEINLMLVSMLRYAGINSNPVLISTRANGISYFPTRTGFNYVIATAIVNGKTVLLDATNKNSLPNILPLRDLNWNGRAIQKDGTSEVVDVMPQFNSSNSINLVASLDEKGIVSGKVREQYNDYYALRFRDNFRGVALDAIAEQIEKKYNGLEITDYEVSSHEILNDPVVEKYNIKNELATEVIGNKIYFSPLLHLAAKENPFKQENREYPIDFSYPMNNRYRVNLTTPNGYSIENLPKTAKVNMENDYGNYSYTISSSGNQIQLLLEFNINASIVPPDDYQTIKEFYKLFIEKQNEKIILKKV